MPRVYLSENERINARIAAWVYGQLAINHMSQKDLAAERGVCQQAISKKLKTESFDVNDLVCFIRVFKPEAEEVMRLLGNGR